VDIASRSNPVAVIGQPRSLVDGIQTRPIFRKRSSAGTRRRGSACPPVGILLVDKKDNTTASIAAGQDGSGAYSTSKQAKSISRKGIIMFVRFASRRIWNAGNAAALAATRPGPQRSYIRPSLPCWMPIETIPVSDVKENGGRQVWDSFCLSYTQLSVRRVAHRCLEWAIPSPKGRLWTCP
jgi:hypothetical protein